MDLATVLVEVADISLDPPRRPWGRAAVPGPGLRCPPYFASLMARCCMNDPEQRPAFAEIAHEVALLDVSSIVDSMLAKANDSLLQETLLHNVVRSSAVVRIPSSFFPETPRHGLTLIPCAPRLAAVPASRRQGAEGRKNSGAGTLQRGHHLLLR